MESAQINKNEIPPITHPLGKHWKQPSTKEILIDDTHAVMSKRIFDDLAEYSCSQPSGVYEGKMWKRNNGVFDGDFLARGGKPEWCLCWFGFAEDPEMVATYMRKIILV